jgi:hypothetical protein
MAQPIDDALDGRMRALLETSLRAEDPLASLSAARDLRTLLYQWEGIVARQAVDAGTSWELIGTLLGVSRQAAWTRYKAPRPETTAIREARERIDRARTRD